MEKLRLSKLFLLSILLSIPLSHAYSSPEGCTPESEENKSERLRSYLKVDSNYAFTELTEAGLEKLKELRDILRTRFKIFNNTFIALENVHHAMTVARLLKRHMYLYGPPGSGKTAAIKWMLDAEGQPSFQIQMHQMVSEQAFVGGQDFEEAKKGRFTVNTEGALVDFIVGLIDEAGKANPATLASLLSLLEEGKVLIGKEEIDAKTETVFATSNANLPEILNYFSRNGMETTASAFLNRFMFKVLSLNWLEKRQRAQLLKIVQEKKRIEELSKIYPELKKDPTLVQAEGIDWESLRFFANRLISFDEYLNSSYNELFEQLHDKTAQAISASELAFKHRRESFVYFPSCEFNTRNLLLIPDVIKYSAFVDFLLSDLADDNNLETFLQKSLTLGPLSLWRGFLAMTTIGPGKASLIYKIEDESPFDLKFGSDLSTHTPSNDKERDLIRNLQEEQNRFKKEFNLILENYQKAIKSASMYSRTESKSVDDDFEILLLDPST